MIVRVATVYWQGSSLAMFSTNSKSTVPTRQFFSSGAHTCNYGHSAQVQTSASLKIRFDWYHCKELSMRHSPNSITALDFSSRQRSQPSHTSTFYNSELCTSLHTLLSSTIPPNWLQWQPLGVAVFDQLSIFHQLNGLPRSNHRVIWSGCTLQPLASGPKVNYNEMLIKRQAYNK